MNRKQNFASSVIHADETVVQVLHEPEKKAKTDSRMWVYCNGKVDGKSNILFEYQSTRNGDHAARFLGDYSGYIVCDGFDGCNKLKKAKRCGYSETALCRQTQLAVFSLGERCGCQCYDVFRGGCGLCEWDECGRILNRAVPL